MAEERYEMTSKRYNPQGDTELSDEWKAECEGAITRGIPNFSQLDFRVNANLRKEQ